MEALREQGNIAFKAGNYAEAAACYTAALGNFATAAQPTLSAMLLCNRSAAYLKQGLPQRALDDAEHAVGLDHENAKAFFRKALSLRQLPGRLSDAIAACRRALELQPNEISISQELESLLVAQEKSQPSTVDCIKNDATGPPSCSFCHITEGSEDAMHVTAEIVSATTAELAWVPRPAWLENSELQVALRRAKLVRIASPFPREAATRVQDELILCKPSSSPSPAPVPSWSSTNQPLIARRLASQDSKSALVPVAGRDGLFAAEAGALTSVCS